jgi:ABC-type antimicrobial peptide transport system permease subunit
LKIAFRNLRKYKKQTLVSVAGLAVGFACFAVATLWIRHEMTYDGFHKNADRMYCVSVLDNFYPSGLSRVTEQPLAEYLNATFPEIACAISIKPQVPASFEINEIEYKANVLEIDSSFFGMFDVKIVEGSMDFLIPARKSVAITRAKARQLFENENPIGKTLGKFKNDEYTICAIVTEFSKQSNYPFDILLTTRTKSEWYYISEHTLIELVQGIDIKAFEKKLYEHEIKQSPRTHIKALTPLTEIHYKDPNIRQNVKFQHIVIFSVVGLLLVLCTLVNYLTLFVSRFRMRQREFALRIAFGSSNRSLLALLSTEFFISLIIALLLGFVLIHIIIPPFRELSGVKLELSSIYTESLMYISGIILIALLIFILILAIFRRRTLNTGIRRNGKKTFRKISIAFQLTISIGFAFCTIIILKQMYHLHNTDLGFAFKNRGSIYIHDKKIDMAAIEDKIRQIPEITETVRGNYSLIPIFRGFGLYVSEWDDKPENAKTLYTESVEVSERFLQYYEIKLTEGELLSDKDESKYVMINESMTKAFGWHNAIGKSFVLEKETYTVKGVIKNIYNMTPTISAMPLFYRKGGNSARSILFKYNEGTWKTCRKKIEEIIAKEYPNIHPYISNAEEVYDEYLKSENTLLRILSAVSLVCVLVCVFGFVSMISLTCEERRKEIAIRKINGATIKDILDIFFREHLALLVIGALVAFPVGYVIMKKWLEGYVVQTEISAWIYLSILLALITAIVLCVGGKVYATSRENPINAIKS